jgi:hypothetical protein
MTSPDPGTTRPYPQEPTPPPRASDADREAVAAILHDAVMRGLLTPEEGHERVTAAYSARFLQELPRLTADLPPAPSPAPVAPGWRSLMLLAWLQLRSTLTRSSWRAAARAPRRLAVAVVALLAVLSLAGMAVADAFDGDHDHSEYHQEVEWDDD